MQNGIANKTILVTGATSGLGRATVLGLASSKPNLVLPCRDISRGKEVADLARKAGAASVEVIYCDLSLMASVREAVNLIKQQFSKIDVLINNAACMVKERIVTKEGNEVMFATNYLSAFLLTNLLMDEIRAGDDPRIINVSGPLFQQPDFDDLDSEHGFSMMKTFERSKAAALWFTYELARRLKDTNVGVCGYCPGLVKSGLMKDGSRSMKVISKLIRVFAITPSSGAKGLIDLVISRDFKKVKDDQFFLGMRRIKTPNTKLMDKHEKLWKLSETRVVLSR